MYRVTELHGDGQGTRSYRRRTVEEKCQIVRETLVPGRSVAEVARAHEVNANQVFDWRKQYLEGRLEPKREDGLMLPVVLSEPDEKEKASAPPETHTSAGVLRVLFARSEVRVEGHVDPDALRVVMQCLSR
jgi:transposase